MVVLVTVIDAPDPFGNRPFAASAILFRFSLDNLPILTSLAGAVDCFIDLDNAALRSRPQLVRLSCRFAVSRSRKRALGPQVP